MNIKLVAIGIIAVLLIGGAYFLIGNRTSLTQETMGELSLQSVQSWSYESVSQDLGFQINKNVVNSGKKGVTGGTYMLDNDVFAGVNKATVTGSMIAKIDFEYWMGLNQGWHQISQWWYKVYYKDKNNDWRPLMGIDTARRTFSPMQPGGLGGPYNGPLTVKADFNFNVQFTDAFKGGAVHVQTYVKLDTGEEFLIQTEDAYVYKEPMHLIVHTTPVESIVVVGEPAMSSNGWKAREIERTTSGLDGVAVFYLTNEKSGITVYVDVSKMGYASKMEMYTMTDHRDVRIDLVGTGTTPPDETKGYTVTVNVVPSGSQVLLFQAGGESDEYGRKTSPSQYVFPNIQPGTYWAEVSNYEWRAGTYYERKWQDEEEAIQVIDQDVIVTITLEENTNPPNQPPTADQPTSSDVKFYTETTYSFYFNFNDPEGESIETIQVDWGDGWTENYYSVYSSNLNEREYAYQHIGTHDIRVRASTIKLGGDEYKCYKNAGLSDPFKFGGWSEPLTITVIKLNHPPKITVYYPPEGDAGSPGISYTFKVEGSDADGDAITYVFNWGDGTKTNPIKGYTTTSAEHLYSAIGAYKVTVMASDGTNTITSTELKDKATNIVGTTFNVAVQKLPKPMITQMFVAGTGVEGTAVIHTNTMVPAHMFDIYVMVSDSKGTIVPREKIDKLFAGSYYVASLTFVPQNPGDVTVTAQLVPTLNVKGLLNSDATSRTEKTSISVGDPKTFDTPVIDAPLTCIKNEPSQFTITIMTNYDKNSFEIYAGVKDSDGISVKPWSKTIKTRGWIYEYTATVEFTSHKVGRLTISTQAISPTESTKVITAVVQCSDKEGNPDWGGIYNPNNNTLKNPDLSGRMYDESKNTRKIPGFEMFMFLFAVAIIVYLRKRRR